MFMSFWQVVQSGTDTGIHLTLGTGVATIIGKIIYDEVRRGRSTSSRRDFSELVENSKEQTKLLQSIATDMEILKDRIQR